MSQFPNSPAAPASSPTGSSQLVLIGAVVAVVAVVLMNIYVEMRVAAADEEEITLFAFREGIPAGRVIDQGDLEPIKIAKKHESAFGNGAVRETSPGSGIPSDGLGFTLNVSVVEGEVLNASHFLASARRTGGNDPEGKDHQITLRVDKSIQPPNLIPGDRIDLWASVPRSRGYETKVIMERVEVAAVGERISDSGDGQNVSKYGSVTINVERTQVADMLDIMQRIQDQEFRISRRAPGNTETPVTKQEGTINPEVLQMLGLD